ncbi:hypothetical protein H920_05733 [Fukomys damarensis]|uniref:Uncharacterized protein n=1 Tax=Fukomys damarensis TaxID=885580 RepID=A0A091DL70_FUKDA|nr:hypothetical protein H920_05733 [Fukomys damarensis]
MQGTANLSGCHSHHCLLSKALDEDASKEAAMMGNASRQSLMAGDSRDFKTQRPPPNIW